MVDFSSLPPIAQRIVLEVDLEFVLSIQRMTLEELVAFAESEHDLDEDDIQVIRDTIVDKLEHRILAVTDTVGPLRVVPTVTLLLSRNVS